VLKSKEVEDTGLMDYVKKAYAGESVKVPIYKFDPTGETEAKGKGRVRWLSTRIYPLKDKRGKVINIVITHEDVSEIKNAEEKRRELESQLRQAHKMESIGTLAGGISHDFNNILSAILGNADMAIDDLPEQSPARYSIDQITLAGHRARDLVKQILAFSRQTEHELKPVKVSLIVREALKLLRPSLPSTIQIRQRIIADRDVVLADPTQIHQVLMNLCTNALNAMFIEGGVLEVNLNDVELDAESAAYYEDLAPGSYLKIEVSDTGHGMKREVMDKIFDPYFTTKERGEGTGMGLAVVHGIVKNFDGSIIVHSEPGKGTAFTVFFPLFENAVKEKSEAFEPVSGGNERILFVDDEEALVNLGKRMLQKLGYEVEIRASSIEALEAFRSQPERYDLVITDMTMPYMTGETLIKEILSIRPDIPIILCTGFSDVITEEKAKDIGIKAFVFKPIIKRELAKTIRELLDE
jgi:signal transduction histidine kinase/CheY-like chemotaxis protein